MRRRRRVVNHLDFWIAMRRASDITYKALSEAMRKHGCTREQFEVLHACELSNRPVTPAELSRWTYREPHSVVGLLNRMEKAGLIERDHNDSGSRRTLISPTPKGREIFKTAYPTLIDVFTRITHQIPVDDLPRFTMVLQKMRDAALGELKTSVLKRSLARHKR